ncbi:exported hypothetical protein [Verrucomicrobia bacterium]|nr:exported hypothetical protein [Verrucomicrobiota bacterium]
MCKNNFQFQGAILTDACALGYAVAADLAKRLECAQLAAAFECQTCPKPPPSQRTPNASEITEISIAAPFPRANGPSHTSPGWRPGFEPKKHPQR